MSSLIIHSQVIWVARTPVDFRRSIDGLCQYITDNFETNPQEGLYVFYNAKRNRLKLLVWHFNGFILLYKRIENGRFPFRFSEHPDKVLVNEKQLQGLLLGLDWQMLSNYKEINFSNYF